MFDRTTLPWVRLDLQLDRASSAANHSLETGWAVYRIKDSLDLHEGYEQYAVHNACDGVDVLGNWWDVDSVASHREYNRLSEGLTPDVRRCFQGYFSIKHELPRAFIAFAAIHVLMLALWLFIFGTSTYAYTFGVWPFFVCISVTLVAFLIATTVAALASRFNFDKGLSRFREFLPLSLHPLAYDGGY